jgi:hypothetical protein
VGPTPREKILESTSKCPHPGVPLSLNLKVLGGEDYRTSKSKCSKKEHEVGCTVKLALSTSEVTMKLDWGPSEQ